VKGSPNPNAALLAEFMLSDTAQKFFPRAVAMRRARTFLRRPEPQPPAREVKRCVNYDEIEKEAGA